MLCFYSKSADKPAPGKGAGEEVAYAGAYASLRARQGWRRTLSNFHECEFKFQGRTYRTVEHAFQAAKIRLVDPAAAQLFTVESGTELGRGDGLAARKQRKMVRLTPAQLQVWDASSAGAMEDIQRAKFSQCPAAARGASLFPGLDRVKVSYQKIEEALAIINADPASKNRTVYVVKKGSGEPVPDDGTGIFLELEADGKVGSCSSSGTNLSRGVLVRKYDKIGEDFDGTFP